MERKETIRHLAHSDAASISVLRIKREILKASIEKTRLTAVGQESDLHLS